ncbi:uncharacterized protein LOC101849040 [Aplysia californica]|uniref:Uncharacterized protein LOC101849040 n=1 Tax=Aplysia californica TaxID=6500 RepID=A0ABM0JJ73_APLCA|nr:uncharacterized protein LOC101849040 [Aplysia californica]
MSFTARHRDELEDKGYTVIEDAVPNHRELKASFFQWMTDMFGEGGTPYSQYSIVRHYHVGHLEPAWSARLQVKKFFEALWGTTRLLTSVDAVAIGQPPEKGVEEFDSEHQHWLHVDQGAGRESLHAYQGAVYLETADHDDWTFEMLEGSHKYHSEFYCHNKKAAMRSSLSDFYGMRQADLEWFHSAGCRRKRVPVKAGSLLLWDSRLVHANARPVKGREHTDRWRLVVLVCMTPCAWSTEEDIAKKKKAYKNLEMTTHWPSDDIGLMGTYFPSYATAAKSSTKPSLPEIAKTKEAKQLAGVTPYKVVRGSRDVAWRPKWNPKWRPDMAVKTARLYKGESRGKTILIWCMFFAICLSVAVAMGSFFQ